MMNEDINSKEENPIPSRKSFWQYWGVDFAFLLFIFISTFVFTPVLPINSVYSTTFNHVYNPTNQKLLEVHVACGFIVEPWYRAKFMVWSDLIFTTSLNHVYNPTNQKLLEVQEPFHEKVPGRRRPILREGVMQYIMRLREKARGKVAFKILTPPEFRRSCEVFRRLLAASSFSSELKEELNNTGFEVVSTNYQNETLYIIIEKEGAYYGGGFYIVRFGLHPQKIDTPNKSFSGGPGGGFSRKEPPGVITAIDSPVLLQAPHGGDDRFTAAIVLQMFLEQKVHAAAFNTLSRRSGDLAHTPQTHFQAFTLAFASVFLKGNIIQLHGFSSRQRDTSPGKVSHMIIGNGTASPPPVLIQRAHCLSKVFNLPVHVYPMDTKELGGTRNSQAEALYKEKFPGFIHIEINLPLRDRLNADGSLRGLFFRCLVGL